MKSRKAIVLLSGGMDSATSLAYAVSKGFDVHALSFSYGQRHKIELKYAKKIALQFNASEHLVISFDLRKIGGSALTSEKMKIPEKFIPGIPSTYVPARNTIFLSFATSWAEVIGARDIFIGVNSLDYSGYPDCRPEFIRSFNKCANLGTRAADEKWEFKIHAPLQKMKKSGIIKLGLKLGVDFSLTLSCYNPTAKGVPCGKCNSCILRLKGFKEAGLKDPVKYGE